MKAIFQLHLTATPIPCKVLWCSLNVSEVCVQLKNGYLEMVPGHLLSDASL